MSKFYASGGNPGKLFIQCNTDSWCEHIAGGGNVNLYGCVCLLAPVCAVCLCVCEY